MKTTMLEQSKPILIGGALLLLAGLGGFMCLLLLAGVAGFMFGSHPVSNTLKADQRVEQSNAKAAEAKRLFDEAQAKFDTLYTEKKQQGPGSTQVAPPAATREVVDLYASAATRYRQAAEKLEQAGALRVDPTYQEYLSLGAQQLRKTAQLLDAGGTLAGLLLETSNRELESSPGLVERMGQDIESLVAEVKELTARREAVEAANPGGF